MENNTYFEAMRKESAIWAEAKKEREARKERILEEYGWDSEELKAWKAEEEAAPKYPFKDGEAKACRAWMRTQDEGRDEVEMEDFLWAREVHDFAEAFRKAGIKTFIYTNESTALMENIHLFAKEGISLEGIATVEKETPFFREERTETKRGLMFRVN